VIVVFRHALATTIKFLHEQREVAHRPPVGQFAAAQIVDELWQLAFGKMRIPRHGDELIEWGRRTGGGVDQ
jgi:hypothetical protein